MPHWAVPLAVHIRYIEYNYFLTKSIYLSVSVRLFSCIFKFDSFTVVASTVQEQLTIDQGLTSMESVVFGLDVLLSKK